MDHTRLIKLRELAGLTQRALALKSGISTSQLSALESGDSENPTWNTLEQLAEALGIDFTLFINALRAKPSRIRLEDIDALERCLTTTLQHAA